MLQVKPFSGFDYKLRENIFKEIYASTLIVDPSFELHEWRKGKYCSEMIKNKKIK